MKKAVSLMMAAAMTMGLAACGSTASTDTAASAADTASSTEAAASTADSTAAADGKVYNIGICQLVQHEALDAATQGFKDALVEKLGEGSVKFDEQNASGDSANCATIVNGFVSNGVDLILANASLQWLPDHAALFPHLAEALAPGGLLAVADGGTTADLERWCIYVLQGVLVELQKVDQLTRYDYLHSRVLHPAVTHAHARGLITAQEQAVLLTAARLGVVKAADLAGAMPGLSSAQRSYQVRKLTESGMLRPIEPKARQYTLGFDNNHLLRGVIHALTAEGFISPALAGGSAAS